MLPSKFDCLPETIVAPLNIERLRRVEKSRSSDYPHMTFDPAYVSYVEKNHGGVPKRQWFMTEKRQVLRLGRFVNFGGPYNEPYQDSWEIPGTDIRESWNVEALETIANIEEGCGAFLVPFGLLYAGDHRPEDMGPIYLDFVCFDYSDESASVPGIVAWNNSAAVDERFACEDEGRDSWTEMRHDRFTQNVASSFTGFIEALFENESDLSATIGR